MTLTVGLMMEPVPGRPSSSSSFSSSTSSPPSLRGYELVSTINTGGFSRINLYHHVTSGSNVAIKQISRKPENSEKFVVQGHGDGDAEDPYATFIDTSSETEYRALCRLSTLERVVKVVDYFKDLKDNYIVMEVVDGVDLFDYIIGGDRCRRSVEGSHREGLMEDEAHNIFKQVCQTLHSIHSLGVFHLDLKLDNLMITKNNMIKVIDFGLCHMNDQCSGSAESKSLRKFVGSMNYCAPEILQRIPFDAELADVWSLGVILFSMLVGRFPWSIDQRTRAIRDNKTHPPLTFPLHFKISRSAKDLLRRMLTVDPHKRARLDQVLAHRWVLQTPELEVKKRHFLRNLWYFFK